MRILRILLSTIILSVFLRGHHKVCAQDNLSQLLIAGVEDTHRFTKAYLKPASEGLVYSLSNSWYQSGKAKKPGKFEISILANLAFVDNSQKKFELNSNEYHYLRFKESGRTSAEVATIFGENKEDIRMIIGWPEQDGQIYGIEIKLPQGIGSSAINFIPAATIQAGIGLIKGTEVKLRYLPRLNIEEASLGAYGVGLQHEITNWLPAEQLLPVHFSLLAGYTRMDAKYKIDPLDTGIDGQNQSVNLATDSWLFTGVLSTNLPVINFYGGLGYVMGSTDMGLNGTYEIETGPLGQQTLIDPVKAAQKTSGVKGSLGVNLKLGFFRMNADYNFQKYNSVVVGLSFGN